MWSTPSGPVPNTQTSPCHYTLELPSEGRYEITLTAQSARGRIAETRQVAVDGRLIVAIGDSIASGEGVPDAHKLRIRWQDPQCHRSARAAPAIAAQTIQARMPATPITFIHLACSGATIPRGLLGDYEGIAPGGKPPLPPQVGALDSIQSRRRISAVLISIGANDVHFGDVVRSCIPALHPIRSARHPRSDCFRWPAKFEGVRYATLSQAIAAARSRLAPNYAKLHAAISSIPSSAVYLMQYYDPTHAADGSTCKSILGIRQASLKEAQEQVLGPLNRIGARAARRYGWHYIDGISHLFAHHGYCARGNLSWVVKGHGAILAEHSAAGVLHPNAEGHKQIAALIAAALMPQLFPPSKPAPVIGGPLPTLIPRVPGPGSITAGDVPTGALVALALAAALALCALTLAVRKGLSMVAGAPRWLASASLLALATAFADLAIDSSAPRAPTVALAAGSVVVAFAAPVFSSRKATLAARVSVTPTQLMAGGEPRLPVPPATVSTGLARALRRDDVGKALQITRELKALS